MHNIFQLQHQPVRDLAWLCTSPPLLAQLPSSQAELNIFAHQTQTLRAWLSALDQQPETLLQHLSQLRSPRLGIYYEALCAYFWQHYPGLQLHQQNLQVSHNGKTYGEYDLITESSCGLYHIEAAVKFYLGLPSPQQGRSSSEWEQWIGPNCNDRLDKKLKRLRDHQLQLASTAQGSAALQQQGLNPAHISPALQLQGYLFYPAHTELPAPAHSHADHLRGKWYYLSDFLQHLKPANSYWLPLPKQLWLAPALVSAQHAQQPLNEQAIAEYLSRHFTAPSHKPGKHTRPILVAKMEQQQQWQEHSRCFIVPDAWPWLN
ncbi:DUF1853 family protein [Dasania sp. GY-MA-18]|uniref:DUF1853 family protein n=1 Tax=Dasania phycosphaerae TaxID=2950436 RepID=A0A9J6RNI7_9GAMM|nr:MULTISPECIES: DUF1853 family protein [Dasania]MCR8923448.1 DUF1853 family protein [Dasania sp. GY-MA-18]MCZ0865881.1 DUF1853 family protein [Dasania phycosphaerae]MCZ0869605.1 DUF1853 family protein [Dasania phycosphaerae]